MSNAERYDEEYFESGVVTNISGYQNYTWMPELTFRMAHYFVTELPIRRGEVVLDYGCAKGFLVKALRCLDVEAYGVDISSYAISCADASVRKYCEHIDESEGIERAFARRYDWVISKDVFEHMTEYEIKRLLGHAMHYVRKMFIIVPLGTGSCNKFIIPAYNNDVTHVTAKPVTWWQNVCIQCGWTVDRVCHRFSGCKENWTEKWPDGNLFLTLSNNNID